MRPYALRYGQPHAPNRSVLVSKTPPRPANAHTLKSMAFGIVQDHVLPHVPGTVHIEETQQQQNAQHAVGNLKHGTGRNKDVVLAPQPSDDPNDPLNWSWTRKVAIVAILMFG